MIYIISDLHRHFGATSAGLFMETKPRRTSYLQRMTFVIPSGYELRPLIYTSTGTTDRRPAELVSFHTKLEEKPKIRVIFKCGGFASGIKIRLDSAALHRRSSSSSELLNRKDCFTLPRAEQVSRPLPRNPARSTVRAKSPVWRFHVRSSYSYQYYFHAVRGKRYTTVSTLSHAK